MLVVQALEKLAGRDIALRTCSLIQCRVMENPQPTILVVEDEPAIADTITYALETDGMESRWCSTGREALSALTGGDIALVVLDIGLPDINGFDLCRKIRKMSSVPIIFLTARGDEVDRVVGLEIGGDDYVVKPFSPRELSARVKAVLRRSGTGGGKSSPCTEISIPEGFPFIVDEKRLIITYFGVSLELSRYEYRLLELLLKRPGWVFTREQLKDMVWDEPEASLERTVDTHIKTLRSKLREIKPDLKPIRTHRGIGYSLRESW